MVGAVMMTLARIVGYNPVGACAKQAMHHLWRYQGILVNDRSRPWGLNWCPEQHDWVVGAGLISASCRGSAKQFSTSSDQIKSDLIEQFLEHTYIAYQMQ